MSFTGFKKRTGRIVKFDSTKIGKAIGKALKETNESLPEGLSVDALSGMVVNYLANPDSPFYIKADPSGKRIVDIETVQNAVEYTLDSVSLDVTSAAYKKWRKLRSIARSRVKILHKSAKRSEDLTDASLLLTDTSGESSKPFDIGFIQTILEKDTRLTPDIVSDISKRVENTILVSGTTVITIPFLLELINNTLLEKGFPDRVKGEKQYQIPASFMQSLMFGKSNENSNVATNNPEAINMGISEYVIKEWMLDNVFSPPVRDAHYSGRLYVHDLGMPRTYCSAHSIEYIKKYGLVGLTNLSSASNPAKSASVLTGHLNTFLASMQAYYAGALGLGYINVFYAPLLVGYTYVQMIQIAQELIFNASQNAFSRGAQTLFLDFNVHSNVPAVLSDVPAIGAGGRYMLGTNDGVFLEYLIETSIGTTPTGRQLMQLSRSNGDVVLKECWDNGLSYEKIDTGDVKVLRYSDFSNETIEFAKALLDVWARGDCYGRVFNFPKCDFHVDADTFKDPRSLEVYKKACDLASINGSTYFIFDRDSVTMAACCRLRTTISDNYMIKHPESLRFVGMQNVTINIPQASYRVKRLMRQTSIQSQLDALFIDISETMDLAMLAHLNKRDFVDGVLHDPGKPLYQIGKESCDGKPYVETANATYIIGLIGLDDALYHITGSRMHENADTLKQGLTIISKMYAKTKELAKIHNIKVTLEESPAESASRRLARTDLTLYPESAGVIQGPPGAEYYTNSVHLKADAPVGLVSRIRTQSMFHSMIESGAIIHAFVGESRPSAESIEKLITTAFEETQCAQITISPEFTYCRECFSNSPGVKECCSICGTGNVDNVTRIVGYFSRIQNWNKSKKDGELVARHIGDYSIEESV